MSVDFFWRRVAGRSLDELAPKELGALVPHWFDAEFKPLREAGMVTAVDRNGCLMHFALLEGDAPSLRIAQLPVYGGERRTGGEEVSEDGFVFETELWVLRPEEVQDASAFLQHVAVDDLVRDLDVELAEEVQSLGFATPWSPAWAADLAADLGELKSFFAAAAAAGDAMVKVEQA
ncbi:hypothetical protein [Kitasatospora sp. CB01950]|uniref:hypothetical protein n=1 Tax=Kitasatospora sp. CB01950 TaxID=1703930 RepID=UPI0009692049|nr:hypothetical protein [Kitasatospora sp. CB01950]OKI99857.1 hypothetical protein AMK19_30455 [Kitasatospora sp. CB01950]